MAKYQNNALVILAFAGIMAQEGMLMVASAQGDTSCLSQLAPCLNYLNGTRHPPDNCCDPLKSMIKSNPQCLCSMISNRATNQAEQAGIDINEAQQLPGRCGERVNPLACLSTGSPPSRAPSNSRNSVPNSANDAFSLLSRGSLAATALSSSLQILLFIGIKYNALF
ncbi:hypothetical protein ACFX2J_022982 [Malus domestica]